MGTQVTRKHCKDCGEMRKVSRQGCNHILHLLLSMFTVGLRLIVWIGSAVQIGGWRCDTCGSKRVGRAAI